MGIDEDLLDRFLSYAADDAIHVQQRGLRSLLECTDSFCMTKHWLPDSYIENIYTQYATKDGIGLPEFVRIVSDGLLLQGQIDKYEKAFDAIDQNSNGVLTREELGLLFAGLGRIFTPAELDRIVDEADFGDDGIDFADFLGLARKHLDLGEVLKYISAKTSPLSQLPVSSVEIPRSELPVNLASPQLLAPDPNWSGTVTLLHSETELDAIVATGADAVVKLAFTWCRPCRNFWPKYKKFAKVYSSTKFLKIVGNENESTKHYAQEVLKVTSSPVFAAYSKGKLVRTWNGANDDRFTSTIEEVFARATG